MTKPQIWVAAFLLLFIVLFMIGRLTKEEEVIKDFSEMNEPTMGEQTTSELTGDKLIQTFGCVNCHGANLEGSNMGPSLIGLKEFWSSREDLINYLRNPNSFMDKDRFKEYKIKYPNGIMPSYNNKDVKDLGKIADYLLTR
jgi:cytochrome c553